MKITVYHDEINELIQKERPNWPVVLIEYLTEAIIDYEWSLQKEKGASNQLAITCVVSLLDQFQFYPNVWTFARAHFLTMKNAKKCLGMSEDCMWLELEEPLHEYLTGLAEKNNGFWLICAGSEGLDNSPFLLGEPTFEHLTITE